MTRRLAPRIAARVASIVCMAAVVAASTWSSAQQTQTRDAAGPAASATGTAVVSGTVVTDNAEGRPVRRVTLTIGGGGLRVGRETVTDDQGRFAFAGLPAGGYTLSATKPGWLTTYFGSRHPGVRSFVGAPLTIAEGERHTMIVLRLLHGSAITGTIVDPVGRPVGADVRLLQFQMHNGERALMPLPGGNTEVGADDLGVYRFYGLAPGEYVVSAQAFGIGSLRQVTPDVMQSALRALDGGATGPPGSEPVNQGPAVSYANVYYPGTVDLTAATTVKVGPDDEKSGIDFRLQLVPTAQISGVVASPDGSPPALAQVSLVPLGPMGQGDSAFFDPFARVWFARTQPDGTFKIPPVAAGRYTILARAVDRSGAPAAAGNPAGPVGRAGGAAPMTLWASQDVTVSDPDIAGVTLTLQPGMTVSGHLVTDFAATTPFDFTRVTVSVTAVDQGQNWATVPPAALDADGAFRLSGVVPGRYRLGVSANANGGPNVSANANANGRRGGGASSGVADWKVASAVVGGHDALDLPFQVQPGENVTDATIKLTHALGEIAGTLTNAAGQPAPDYVIVVFSADRAYWSTTGRRMPAPTATPRDGTFRISNLPAGEYFLFVATDIDPDTLHDPAVLEPLSAQAVRITLAAGEKRVQDLKIGAGPRP